VATHLLSSAHVAQTFKIQVMQPAQTRESKRRFPVVYLTDGNAVFDFCRGIAQLMQASERESPPFILVAIGYPSDSPFAGNVLRGRDLSFEDCPDFITGCQFLQQWDGVLSAAPGTSPRYGAENFQRFIDAELIPFIDREYPTAPRHRTYFGHSAGGGFGLFTLFTQTRLFQNYIVSSPILTYHGTTAGGVRYEYHDFMLERARTFIASGQSLEGVRLYMSVGAEEELDPLNANWQLTSSFYRMVSWLRAAAIPGLKLMAEAFPGETHTTAWPIAFMHGIQAVFGTRQVA